jgi:hypothetical protein
MLVEIDKIRKNQSYEVIAPIANILSDFSKIQLAVNYTKVQQNKQKKRLIKYFGSLVATVVISGLVFWLVSNNDALALSIGLSSLIIMALIIAIIYEIFMGTKANLNISDYRYQSTQKILQMLDRDMDKTSNLEMKLSFKPISKREYITETVAHESKSGWKIDKYAQEWLKIKGKFLDKSCFQLDMTELNQQQYGWKRSSSGKSKYKTKAKSMGLNIHLVLSYSPRKYPEIKKLENEVNQAIQLPKYAYIKSLKVTAKNINLLVRIAPKEDNVEHIYQTVTMMFLSFYQILNLSKLISKP